VAAPGVVSLALSALQPMNVHSDSSSAVINSNETSFFIMPPDFVEFKLQIALDVYSVDKR
jgi:hypothetical protein